jgi:hypothetical protein
VIGRSRGGAAGVGGNTGDYGLKGEPGRDEQLDGRRLRVDDAAKFELTLQRLTTQAALLVLRLKNGLATSHLLQDGLC